MALWIPVAHQINEFSIILHFVFTCLSGTDKCLKATAHNRRETQFGDCRPFSSIVRREQDPKVVRNGIWRNIHHSPETMIWIALKAGCRTWRSWFKQTTYFKIRTYTLRAQVFFPNDKIQFNFPLLVTASALLISELDSEVWNIEHIFLCECYSLKLVLRNFLKLNTCPLSVNEAEKCKLMTMTWFYSSYKRIYLAEQVRGQNKGFTIPNMS